MASIYTWRSLIAGKAISAGIFNSTATSFLPGLIPRLNDSLRNIPEIKVRLEIPFGNQQTEGKISKDITGLNENGLEHKQNAESASSSAQSHTGVDLIPEEFFYDNGILLAVPKKKVSHRRKRNHQLGPGSKHQKEVLSLDRCPSCGHIKRRNALCMHCVGEIRAVWKERARSEQNETAYEEELSVIDEQTTYPQSKESTRQKKLREKEYLYKPPRTLPFEKKN